MNRVDKGFTLAEVLITLAVVGIVAAMSIPSLIAETNNMEYVTALKKFVSEFTQGLQKTSSDNGCVNDLQCTGVFSTDSNCQDDGEGSIYCDGDDFFAWEGIKRQFNNIKNCGTTTTGCWSNTTSSLNYNLSNFNVQMETYVQGSSAMLGDGTSLLLSDAPGNCTPTNNFSYDYCGTLFVDINGFKGPNQLGRDVFKFWIAKTGTLVPYGGEKANDGVYWNRPGGTSGYVNRCNNTTGTGWVCAARIMEEGWQMTY